MRTDEIGVVVIGRNEAARLSDAIASALGGTSRVVYVDSDSTDGSSEIAASRVSAVVRLDGSSPLSAALARNVGFRRAVEQWDELRFVQFLDGDCALAPGWIETAAALLRRDPCAAVACGRLRERSRGATVYSRLLDMEFDREPGDVAACGGIFMVRASVFREVGGFDPTVPAGEEPEFCLRIRRLGHRIVRLPDEMASHDGGLHTFRDWWWRAARSGRAYAQATDIHGRDPERSGVRESASIWGWALGVPVGAAGLGWLTGGWSLLLLALLPMQAMRIACRRRRPGAMVGDRLLFGAAFMVAKFAQLQGQISYWVRRTPRRHGVSPGAEQAEVTSCSRSSPS